MVLITNHGICSYSTLEHPGKAEILIDGSSLRDTKCLYINLSEATHCLTILLNVTDILNIGFYTPRILYMNFTVTTNPKPITDTQKIKRKKAKQNTTETHQSQRKRAKE